MRLNKRVDVEEIKNLRKSKNVTITEVSSRIGYKSPTGYAHLERGNARFPAAILAEGADVLGVRLEELLAENTFN